MSTGACIGHVGPEALEGGPIGKLIDGDLVRIVVDTGSLEASVDLVGHGEEEWTAEEAALELEQRQMNPAVEPDADLPADTMLWAQLQSVSGGLWGGCVYDHEAIAEALGAGAVDTPATDNRLSGRLS